ncbi:MAG: TolC family protein [Spirochaetes bacterium]|nr:TolC family protein [Spirochaetota bacterium]
MKVRVLKVTTIFLIMSVSISLTAQDKNLKKNNFYNRSAIEPFTIQTSSNIKFKFDNKEYELGEVLRYIIEHNENIAQIVFDAAMADSDYTKFQTKYSPVLVVDGKVKDSKYPDDAVTGFSGTGQMERSATVAVAKGFSSGTTLTAGVKHSYINTIDMVPDYGDTEYHQTAFFVKAEQELLKNILGYQDRRTESMLKNKEKIVRDITLYNVSLLSLDAIINAWDYAVAYSASKNAELKYRETIKVRSIVQSNVNLGLNESFYLNYWNSLVASSELKLSQTEYSLKEKERNFLLKFNIDNPETVKDSVAVLANELPEIDIENALKTAYLKRADYTQAKLALENAEMALEVYKNDALPSLKAGLSVTALGQRDHVNDSYGDSTSTKYPNYEATISMTLPLDNKEQQTNERNGEIMLKQARLELSNVTKEIQNEVLNSIDALKTSYNVYTKAKKTRVEAEIYYTRLKQNLRRGRFSAADIRDALDGLIDSRQGELQALIRYNASLLQLDITQNRFFEKYGIDMAEIIKKKKENNS